MSRTRRFLLAYAAGIGYSAVTMLVGLAATPLLLEWLGDERFGAFRASLDLLGILALLELGLLGALRPLLAQALAQGDEPRVQGLVGAGLKAYVLVGLAMGGLGALLLPVLPHLVPVSAAGVDDLRAGWILGVLAVTSVALAQPLRALIEAQQRQHRVHVIALLQYLLYTGGALALAAWGWGVSGQYAAYLGGGLLQAALLLTLGRAGRAGLLGAAWRVGRESPHWKALWSLNWPTLVRQVAGQLSLMCDTLIVAFFLGPAAVVPLYATQRLALIAQSQLMGVSAACWPALAELHAQGAHETFRQRVLELTTLVVLLGSAVLVPIAAFGEPFVALWVGAEAFGGDAVLVVSAANALLLALVGVGDWCFAGTGKVARLIPVTIAFLLINVPVSVLLTPELGVVGPLVGTLASLLATRGWYGLILLRREFAIPLGALLWSALRPLLLTAPFAGGLWVLAQRHPPQGWLSLAAAMAGAALLYALLAWWLVFRRAERERWWGYVQHVLGRVPPAPEDGPQPPK